MKKTRRSIFFLVAALLLAAVGLSAGPPAGAGPPPGTPGLEKAKEVANEHATELLDHLGIAGVGAGLTESGDPAVVVLTESEGVDVPATLGGLPVVVVVTGKIRALAPPSAQASFTYVCSGLICDFDGSSSRGRRLSYGWDFGDGNNGTGQTVSHTFAEANSYPVSLTVTDKDGVTDSTNQDVTVTEGGDPPPPPPPPSGDPDCAVTGQTTVKCQWPVPLAVSIGQEDITAGTLGLRVTNGTDVLILSNNHVLANENNATIGDPILQPGPFDGGDVNNPDHIVGTLDDFEPIVFSTAASNIMDAAVAVTSVAKVGNATPNDGYGTPATMTKEASVGLKVTKYGRTTGQTDGRIYAIGATLNVGYDGGVARFVDQIVVIGGGFSRPGDSGSLVVERKTNKPVALLFAGSNNSTILSPIDPILARFGVTVDGS